MGSLGLWLSVAVLVLTVVNGAINSFGDKDRKSTKATSLCISIASCIAGIILVWNSSRSGAQQAAALEAISTKQQEALAKADELSKNLRAAQKKTEQISTDLSTTSKTVSDVLADTRRGLQPIQTLGLLFELGLPASDPEVASKLAEYRKLVNAYPVYQPPDPRFILLNTPSSKVAFGLTFPPGSQIYPKPETALGLITQGYRVNMQFHVDHCPPSRYAGAKKPKPDLSVDFFEGPSQPGVTLTRWLQTERTGPLVYTLSSSSAHDGWRSNGRILSMTDIIHSQVVVQPVFGIPTANLWREAKLDRDELAEAQTIWEGARIHSITLSSQDGRRWLFDVAKSATVHQFKVPIFVGQFHRLMQPLDAQ